jgi:hypothetical protein
LLIIEEQFKERLVVWVVTIEVLKLYHLKIEDQLELTLHSLIELLHVCCDVGLMDMVDEGVDEFHIGK